MQQNSMQESGYLPRDSFQERGEQRDKIITSPTKIIFKKRNFRELSVTDIMPSLKARLTDKQVASVIPKNSTGLIAFSKQFSHFVTNETFLSYLEVSDYLEIRKGCKYLWDCYDYHILEELVKMGNLDIDLRANLWLSVTPYHRNQRKCREIVKAIEEENSSRLRQITNPEIIHLYAIQENLDCCSVFDNVYTKLLEKSKSFDYLVRKITHAVEKFKDIKLNNSIYEEEDFEVLINLTLCNNILLPEHSSDKLEYLDALYQGSRDEEIAFWISLCIADSQAYQRKSQIKKMVDMKTLEILAEKYCPHLYKLMLDSKQWKTICTNFIENFGCKYFDHPQSLSIIDSFLVSGMKGFYERVLVIFKDIEDFIQQCINEESKEIGTCKSFMSSKNAKKEAFTTNFESESCRITPETDFITPRKSARQSVRNYLNCYSYSELSFETFANCIGPFSSSFIIKLTENDIKEVQKQALKTIIEGASFTINDKIMEKEEFSALKMKLKILNEKKEKDLEAILLKKQNLNTYYNIQQEEFQQIEESYLEFQDALDHLNQKITILKDTQTMIKKEIWRKKQLLKIACNNKTFYTSFKKSRISRSKSPSTLPSQRNSSMNGPSSRMEERSDSPNNSFRKSTIGVSFPPGLFKSTLQEEALELQSLKRDVQNIEDKISCETECINFYKSQFEHVKQDYQEKKSSIDDLMEFKSCIIAQERFILENYAADKEKLLEGCITLIN
ncbi:unnamed protein product [Moneuplotes crassus]|uniref:Uncharacterized protein n=1 Tax=Euplotes crassus TaxID=5936 RepID=A0AAD1XE29_EUPCR|nr:unnamed protein product [Moneuplotes crassus]